MSRSKKTSNSSAPRKASRAKQAPVAQPEAHLDTISAKTTTEEQIRLRAYDLFLQRGGFWGVPDQDWFQAEAEMRGQHVS
jgi:hypothetical protein